MPGLLTLIIKGPTQSFCWLCVMPTIDSLWLMWGTVVATVMEVCYQIRPSVKHLKINLLPYLIAVLPGMADKLPYVFIGDEAFPLKVNMLRPYPGKNLEEPLAIYNYRLSRARRIIENSFGILAARWRIFRKPIIAEPAHAVLYTQAAIALHNYLRSTESSSYCPPGYVNGEDGTGSVIEGNWRSELSSGSGSGLESIGNVGSNRYICCICRYYYKCNICYRYSRDAAGIRDLFKDFFSSSDGEVAWQYNYVRRTS